MKTQQFCRKNCYGLNVRLSAPTFGILLWTLLCSMWCCLGRFLAPQELGPWWLAFGGCLVLACLLSPSLLPVCSEVKKPLRTWLLLPQHLAPVFGSSNHRLEVLELSRTHIPSSLRCSCLRFCYSGEKQQQQTKTTTNPGKAECRGFVTWMDTLEIRTIIDCYVEDLCLQPIPYPHDILVELTVGSTGATHHHVIFQSQVWFH